MLRIKTIVNLITYTCVLIGYISVYSHVNLYYSLVFAVMFSLAAYLDYNKPINIPRLPLTILSLCIIAISIFRASSDFIVEPALDALIILIAIKLLEDKKFRDYMQILAMCMFLLMGSCLLSLSIAFLVYLTLFLFLTTSALLILTYFSQDPELVMRKAQITKTLYHSCLITCISLPASLLFFIILPRTNYPLFSFLNKETYAVSGFGDSVKLGQVSEIQEDNGAIFRAEMGKVNEAELYWRGIVLDKFDGTSWAGSGARSVQAPPPEEREAIKQTIYLEPYGNKYLFALDAPISIRLKNRTYSSSDEYSLGSFIYDRIRYTALSSPSGFLPEKDIDRAHYLALPRGFSPAIKNLVERLTQDKGETDKIQLLLHFLKWGKFKYSMVNLPVSGAPLEEFLFKSKFGNCEYFASSLAVMLRMAGIPTRLVGGYLGGYYNDAGRYYLVLQKNAHVWVEAYTAGGWMRLDPTPDATGIPGAALHTSPFLRIRILMDTFNYYWYKLIINYDFRKQLMILERIRSTFRKPHLENFRFSLSDIPVKGLIAFVLTPLAILFVVYGISARGRSPGERLMATFQKRMDQLGYSRRPGEGLEELVSRMEPGDLRDRASGFVDDFERIFYRDREFSKEELRNLRERIKTL
jgi:transglutaminase-like putative cysteine protease